MSTWTSKLVLVLARRTPPTLMKTLHTDCHHNITMLGKRKDVPQSADSPPNPLVDAAFQRLFGYTWGTTFNLSRDTSKEKESPSSIESEMVDIFGHARTARILNTPWDAVAPLSCDQKVPVRDSYNPAAMLTRKIVSTTTVNSVTMFSSSTTGADPSNRATKKMRLEEIDYKSIALPAHLVSTTTTTTTTTTAVVADAAFSTKTITAGTTKNSSLDNVLNQIAGKKQINTVEKSSNDWEGFKETDKNLQDELERQAQGKNAYLVKQDFLNRVDQRTFELEKEERDKERSRRATDSR